VKELRVCMTDVDDAEDFFAPPGAVDDAAEDEQLEDDAVDDDEDDDADDVAQQGDDEEDYSMRGTIHEDTYAKPGRSKRMRVPRQFDEALPMTARPTATNRKRERDETLLEIPYVPRKSKKMVEGRSRAAENEKKSRNRVLEEKKVRGLTNSISLN
jgi:hypothetical protein